MNFKIACHGVLLLIFPGAAILNNCDLSCCPFVSKQKIFCVKTIRATVTRHNYSRWRCPGNLKVKIRDLKVHFFFRLQALFLRKLSSEARFATNFNIYRPSISNNYGATTFSSTLSASKIWETIPLELKKLSYNFFYKQYKVYLLITHTVS